MDPARTLVVVSSADLSPEELEAVRREAALGAEIVAWQHPIGGQDRLPSPDVAQYLHERGIDARTLAYALGDAANREVDEALLAYFKELGRKALDGGGSFRESSRLRGLSLWWWAELWLYYDTELRLHVRDVEALARLLERRKPDRLLVVAPVSELGRFARSFFATVELLGPARPRRRRAPRPGPSFVAELLKMLGTGVKSSLRGVPRPAEGEGRRVLCFTHASMWRRRVDRETGREEDVEIYFDGLIPRLVREGNVARVVGIGPRVPFQRRGPRQRLLERLGLASEPRAYVPVASYFTLPRALEAAGAYVSVLREWHRLRRAPRLGEALSHRGVPLEREGRDALREAFLRLVPSAMRSFIEVRGLLEVETPDVLALYAESTALGRATVAAAASLSVPTFAFQHGIMYPHYYSHEHAADEVVEPCDGTRGVPLPTRTAVFGREARRLLLERGHFAPERVVVTGSPKFDALLEESRNLDPRAIRDKLGLDASARLLVVASRFSSIGPVFPDLVRAASAAPDAWLLVKPHQAESPEPYLAVIRSEGAERVRVLEPLGDLRELIVASDGLVTVDSFASSEALVLGRPVLVVSLPNNLQSLVDAGMAVGVPRGEDMREALATFLDPRWLEGFRERLARRRDDFAYGADGGSTERLLEALYQTAKGADT